MKSRNCSHKGGVLPVWSQAMGRVFPSARWVMAVIAMSFGIMQLTLFQTMTQQSSLGEYRDGEFMMHRMVHRGEDTEIHFQCHDTIQGKECCAPWNIQADEWWLHKPDYEVSLENETHFCFAPVSDSEKANFLRRIHRRQWSNGGRCDQLETSVETNAGFGASHRWLVLSFFHAHKNDKPFQIEWNPRRWLYAAANRSSWAYCPSEDITCYYLPISPCGRNVTTPKHEVARMDRDDNREKLEFLWLQHYMMRPRQQFRRKLYEMKAQLDIKYPCTTMHIRRGDSGLPRPPYRRYAAVQEYIDAAGIKEGDNIVLLTDDQSTIDEVKKYHPLYKWIYLERPRTTGVSLGFNGHIPSGDEAFELLAIETELRIAASCDKVVCGQSGFMESLIHSMDAEKKNYSLYFVDTRVSKAEAMKYGSKAQRRAESLLKAVRQQQRQKKSQKPKT